MFTVLADVSAAFLLVAGGHQPIGRFALILVAGVCLYWAGMVLNDVFDIEKDRAERPKRPLPSGAISLSQATIAGWTFLLLGVILAAVAGYLPGNNPTWLPAAIALALAAAIVAYDGPLKATPVAPAAMGGCRVLSFLLGASPVITVTEGVPVIPRFILGIAFGFGVYVMGITTLARDEATGGHRVNLRTGFIVMVIGAIMLAMSPGLASLDERRRWVIDSGVPFIALIGMIVMPVLIRAFRVQFQPSAAQIGNTIRISILTIIPLSASFALLGGGPAAGLAVFGLVVPAIFLSQKLRVT